jgi:DNA-binding transcriptional ArsR family regulator
MYGRGMDEVRRLDAAGLRALAHPLRVRMLGSLRNDGPATATQLAARLGESTGTTSWHLRRLADAGFIEEDPDRGTKRDRWWRPRSRTTLLAVRDFVDRPELRGPLAVYLQSVLEQQFARAADFLEQAERWLPAWQDAATFSDEVVRLDPTRLEALNEELFAVIERYRAEPVEDGQTVVVQVQSFPRGDAG